MSYMRLVSNMRNVGVKAFTSLIFLLLISCADSKNIGHPGGDVISSEISAPNLQQQFLPEEKQQNPLYNFETSDVVYDDGPLFPSPMENALFNYLYTRRMMKKVKEQSPIDFNAANNILKKRNSNGNYWKQCAFNAISCFGKKK